MNFNSVVGEGIAFGIAFLFSFVATLVGAISIRRQAPVGTKFGRIGKAIGAAEGACGLVLFTGNLSVLLADDAVSVDSWLQKSVVMTVMLVLLSSGHLFWLRRFLAAPTCILLPALMNLGALYYIGAPYDLPV